MAKVRDLTPRNAVRPASEELKYEVTPGELPMADNWGGFQVFSQSFKRGFGNDIYGVDQNGLWMGAAEFADAPFSVDYQGRVSVTSADGKTLKITAADNNFIVNDGTNDIILIGYQNGGF